MAQLPVTLTTNPFPGYNTNSARNALAIKGQFGHHMVFFDILAENHFKRLLVFEAQSLLGLNSCPLQNISNWLSNPHLAPCLHREMDLYGKN